MKAGSDFKAFTNIRAGQRLSLGPTCEERIDKLEDEGEEFVQNAAHKNKIIENTDDVQRCGGST